MGVRLNESRLRQTDSLGFIYLFFVFFFFLIMGCYELFISIYTRDGSVVMIGSCDGCDAATGVVAADDDPDPDPPPDPEPPLVGAGADNNEI